MGPFVLVSFMCIKMLNVTSYRILFSDLSLFSSYHSRLSKKLHNLELSIRHMLFGEFAFLYATFINNVKHVAR